MRAKQFSLRLECAYIWNRTKNDATRNLNFGRCIHDIPLLQWAFPYDDTVFWNRRRAAGAGGRRPAHYTRRLARDGCGNRTSGRGGHAHDHVAEPGQARARRKRSEEHTSELQSPVHLVCRLLLEKKNIQSTPVDQEQPKYWTIEYAKPGDTVDVEQPVLFTLETKQQVVIDNTLFLNPYNMTNLTC